MFDIVGGTGIGGFYAILFTVLNMTIGQVLLCHKILEDKLLSSPVWAGKDCEGCSKLLDEALHEMQYQTGVSVELDSPFRSQASTKCFVLVQNNGRGHHPRALRNYRVRTVPSSRCTIRQALHTTFSDLEHLPPVVIQDEHFISACVHFPNSSRELMKELVVAFPKSSHLACFVNIGAGRTQFGDCSETVAQDLLSQSKDVGCFFRLSMKHDLDVGAHVKSSVMGLLEEDETSLLVDDIVQALIRHPAVIPLLRLVNLAGEDIRAQRDAEINTIHHDVKHLRQAQDQSLFRQLKEWLKPIDHASKLESSNRSRGPTTCEWFLEHPVVEEWIRTGGLCWFHGGMGTGKTFTMSHLIQTMIDQGHTVAYYYFEFTNPSTLSEEALLRSLVFQLSSIHLQTILAVHEAHRGGASEPQLSTLLESIATLAGRSEQPFFIVIDALDEAPQPHRIQLFKTLERMNMVESNKMHVIISSRDEIDIMSGLGELAQHKVDVMDGKVRHDISVFVDQELAVEKWKDWPSNLIEKVRVVLNERAAGQFRMVACQLEVFHRAQTTSDLEARLRSLPTKLTDTYLYILDHLIPEDEKARAQMLLRILTAAFGPVSLEELAALIAVKLGDPSDAIKLPQYQAQQLFHQPQNIVGLGTAFVRLTYDGHLQPHLQLSHASVKEYLLQQDEFHWCYMDEQLAHSTMAGACLALLLHHESSQSDDVPISEYVRQRWFQHVPSNPSSQLLTQQIVFFEKFPWSQETQFEFNESPHFYHRLTKESVYLCPLIAASAAGLYGLLQVMLATPQLQDNLDQALCVAATIAVETDIFKLLVEKGADLNREVGGFGTALQAAASQGHLNVVRFLVETGADVNKEGEEYGTALHAAAEGGYLDVAEFLLENGVDVNQEAGHYGTSLHAATAYSSLHMVEFLIEKGADMNKEVEYYGTALHVAASGGQSGVIQLLVEKGVDANKAAGHYGAALQAAACAGHLDSVKLLIEKGADVNREVGYYGTALQAAACAGHVDAVKLLIEKGAGVNREVGYYGTALHAAASGGELGVIQLLVEKGVDVNKEAGPYGTALQAAARSGHLHVVRWLVEEGADVNQEGRDFGPALQAASWSGHLEVIKLLVEKGADVNMEAGPYGTALQVAAWSGDLDTVKLLVELGADVNQEGRDFGPALQAAAWSGRIGIIKLLVEEGADANMKDRNFGTALQVAAWSGHLDVVKLLIKEGADVNQEGREFGPALQAAASKGKLEVVEFLVEAGADVNQAGGKYGSALEAAGRHDQVDVVEFLNKRV
ncbi:ankyrin repeat-containing domain protein [Flagelloscypha sp. PMI_526]|nr:ankyrin repeat-containing domain protein [Flagelloscypha sp. PMI_526]